jgi:hypothetical protein
MREEDVEIQSADGLRLGSTLTMPDKDVTASCVLVHGGGGVGRHEWRGYFDRFAASLAARGIASLRFDHRAFHAATDSNVELTLSGVANDIDGADHGFSVPGDVEHVDPQTQEWQAKAFLESGEWIEANSTGNGY